MGLDELRALVSMMREQGITSYKTPELELTLSPQAPRPKSLFGDSTDDQKPAEQNQERGQIPPRYASIGAVPKRHAS